MSDEVKHEEISQVSLKNKLIAMNEMPQVMLLKEIGARNCIHYAEFCLSDQECWGCDLSEECLEIIGRFNNLSSENHMSIIQRKIAVARNYIVKKLGGVQHARIGCRCESCNWLRELEIIFLESN